MLPFQVSTFAGVLVNHGVQRGDRVLIYMPMIPEALIAMLACARVGAIHSVVFGGFAAKELSSRISHCEVLLNLLFCSCHLSFIAFSQKSY